MLLKCKLGDLKPSFVVQVAKIRALKMHGGGPKVVAGSPLPLAYRTEGISLVTRRFANLKRHIQHANMYGVPVAVCCIRFLTDAQKELDIVVNLSRESGPFDAVVSNHWEESGRGAVELGKVVIRALKGQTNTSLKFLYDNADNLNDKIRNVARNAYGTDDVELSNRARLSLKSLENQGFGSLPTCIAKPQYSLSADMNLGGAPVGFTLPVREVCLSAGAGFVLIICGTI